MDAIGTEYRTKDTYNDRQPCNVQVRRSDATVETIESKDRLLLVAYYWSGYRESNSGLLRGRQLLYH